MCEEQEIRSYDEGLEVSVMSVEDYSDEVSDEYADRLVVVITNADCVTHSADLQDLIDWVKQNRPDMLK